VTGRPPSADGTITATCLQNILVLSAGTTIQPDARGQTIQAATVTLLASPDEAETLTLANNEGRIQLVLRNGSDHTIEKTPGRDIGELYGVRGVRKKVAAEPAPRPRARPVVAAAPTAPPLPPPPPDQIIVIRGTTKTVETVGANRPTTDGGK
jgi:Flp pilus assembly protein CpaB